MLKLALTGAWHWKKAAGPLEGLKITIPFAATKSSQLSFAASAGKQTNEIQIEKKVKVQREETTTMDYKIKRENRPDQA